MILCDGLVDLRCGDWREVLADVEVCDAVITDPPYSARTHEGQAERFDRASLGYSFFTDDDVAALVTAWSARARSWFVCMTDDVLSGTYRKAYAMHGRLDFAPLPILQHRPRLQGDGPGSGCVWMPVARPREQRFNQWGSLPPWYEAPPEKSGIVLGQKPLGLMRAIVRDYTRPGDLVVDPFCGGGTTALACAMEGRRCITSEIDPETFAKAKARLERGFTPDMFTAKAGE